jgi:chromosomal replication initiator protein
MLLAERVPGNIRALEGALTRLAAQASIELSQISMEMAEAIIDRYYQSAGLSKPSLNQIIDLVGSHYKIDADEIRGTSRKAPIAHARHVAVYLTREITGDSWKHIGTLFGDRDHTSMMHAHQKISELMTRDKDLNAVVNRLLRDLYPSA